ncbi:hypothetical protein [Terriglobus tenax]|uniref:hypothetical protein n=1 Tax=Terriglobus tenax TaxID=1111115 RepID=UPI0021E0690B|nr:hypothetical protein [Terriglobus tenax]
MSLMDAPVYDEKKEKRRTALLVLAGLSVLALVLLFVGGYIAGHGWFFSNLPAEHKVDKFLTAIEHKDFDTAYGLYVNDPEWKTNLSKHSGYSIKRFTEDWTTYSKVGEIKSHHVDISRTDGEGFWGTSIIVGTTINGSKKFFMSYIRKDGTLSDYTYHIIQY